ncbi:metal ABC transporter ATP-binding protein [Thermodesulfobacteriota bacterium]
MDTPVIEVQHLDFSYTTYPVLEDVSFSMEEGDFLAVIGPNGGGKTTLLRLMLGLLTPDRGTVRVFGSPPAEVAPRIGYVPQDRIANKSVPVSVFQVVLMGRMWGGGGFQRFNKDDKEAVRDALERMEMWEFRNRRVSELSGGQLQRVLVARAICSHPELLLLDEPMANVDTKGQAEFYALLKDLNTWTTIVVVSHDLMALSSYVKSVACVSRQVFFHGAPEITKDMFETAYHCPVELIAHGLPHRVLEPHGDE